MLFRCVVLDVPGCLCNALGRSRPNEVTQDSQLADYTHATESFASLTCTGAVRIIMKQCACGSQMQPGCSTRVALMHAPSTQCDSKLGQCTNKPLERNTPQNLT